MRHTLLLLVGLFVGLACSTPAEKPESTETAATTALPEVRYYVINDT